MGVLCPSRLFAEYMILRRSVLKYIITQFKLSEKRRKQALKKNGTRLLSLLLILTMVLSFAPTAFAAEVETAAPAEEESYDSSWGEWEDSDPAEAPVEEEQPEEPAEEPAEDPAEEPVAEEEPALVEEPVAEEEPVEVAYPANTFFYVGGSGLRVTVDAPEGAFPIDARMVVNEVRPDAVQEVVTNAGVSGNVLIAADISFRNAEGAELEPDVPVEVAVTASMPKAKDLKVVHIDDDNNVEEVNQLPEGAAVNAASVQTASDARTLRFEAKSFSVYAVIGEDEVVDNNRATVNFISKGTTVATVYVKNADTADDLQMIVYDPGAGTLASGEMFRGWIIDKENYSSADLDDVKTIAEVRSYLEGLEITGDSTVVNVYAVIAKTVTLTYVDEKGTTIGSTGGVLIGSDASIDLTINMDYTPPEATQNFEGWVVAEGSSNIISASANSGSGTEADPYKLETVLTVKGNVKLSVRAPFGHWLVFNENGKGAKYNAPQFVEDGQVTQRPCPDYEMIRYGYTFGGWYTDKDCTTGNEFTFGGKLTDRTEIFAKWTARATAPYTIIIWKQNVEGNGYDFGRSLSLTGNVGQNVNSITSQGNGDSAYAIINGTNYTGVVDSSLNLTGLHLDRYDTSVEINPEGTAVVNVYYNRNTVTLTFYVRGYYGGWSVDQTMTGLYGSTLADNGYTWPTDYRWTESRNGGTTTTFLDAFIPSDGSVTSQTFYGQSRQSGATINFYKQNDNLNGYTLTNTVYTGGGDFTITDKYNGYQAYQYSKNGGTRTSVGTYHPNNKSYGSAISDYRTLDIYFNLRLYNILFMDGVYVDGNGNPVDGYDSRGQLKAVENVPYRSDVSSYNKGGSNYYAPTYDGFVFDGWYTDDACKQPFTFNKMPEGIVVYAKWVQIQYRVFLHPQAGTDPTLDWGSDDQDMNFRVSSGGKVSAPTGRRTGYDFVGWFLDANGKQLFNADAFILNETTVTTPYDKTKDFTDPMDKWGNGATTNNDVNRSWITKKLDLYAKWRATIYGADGIGVIYDPAEGSNAPSDTSLYLDDADAVAQAASTAPEGKVFDYWVVQTWNGSAFEDTAEHVLPGAIFKVYKANAKVVERDNPDVVVTDPVKDGSYIYTVQLKAVYKDAETPEDTHITWYSNIQDVAGTAMDLSKFTHAGITEQDAKGWFVTDKPTGDLQINEAVAIRPATTYAYANYEFLGWAKKADATEDELFLKYDAEKDEFTAQNSKGEWVAVTEVAADERNPIDDLYAIWTGKFFVVHSGAATPVASTEAVVINKTNCPNGKYDLTQGIDKTKFLYGGYAIKSVSGSVTLPSTDIPYDGTTSTWTWNKMATDAGNAITPVPGETYYIKEVPAAKYLQAYTHYTYFTTTGKIGSLFMISDIDDLNYGETGVVITDNLGSKVYKTLTIEASATGKKVTLKPNTVFYGKAAATNYLTCSDDVKGSVEGKTMVMYWVTPDGATVTGTVSRQLSKVVTQGSITCVNGSVDSEITFKS